MFSPLSLSLSLSLKSLPKTLTPPPPPAMTTNDCHELSFLAAGARHRDEHFNQSRIFKIHLKDWVENEALNLSFVVSSR